jgi:lysophospholipase L1-like esterase
VTSPTRPPRSDPPALLLLKPRAARRGISIALGLAAGLAAAEGIFWARDEGAFPHLNLYVPDEGLGVRLRPGASQRLAFSGNPVTEVRVNAEGFRGADFPPPGSGEILVVGDSQVFGLGVEEHQTFSAELARILNERGSPRPVINAGVPTYGPAEYRAVVDEQTAKRRPTAVVFVVNFVNDLFEASRPNRDRHRVWDGWAVRAETAPDHVTSFPGRELLFRRSHAFYALRRLLFGSRAPETHLPSEGSWSDLLRAASEAKEAQEGAERETARLAGERRRELKRAAEDVVAAQLQLEELAYKSYPELFHLTSEGIEYRKTHGNPGDILIIESTGAESARPGIITAKYLLKGAEVRAKVEKQIRDRAAVEIKKQEWQEVLRSFEHRADQEKRLAELHAAPVEILRAWSPLLPELRRVKAICDERGASLVVVALPMDVQVSKEEWAKYGPTVEAPLDMEPSRVLIRDLIDTAESIGALALDATPALEAAEPGAFLHADIHMTPKGHRALAEALAVKLIEAAGAPPPRDPGIALNTNTTKIQKPPLPIGRSLAPEPDEWEGAARVPLRGRRDCDVRTLREWVLLACARGDRNESAEGPARVVAVSHGGHGEVMTFAAGRFSKLLAPVVPGEDLKAEIVWADGTQRVHVRRPKDGSLPEVVIERLAAHPADRIEAVSNAGSAPLADLTARLCACHREVTGDATCEGVIGGPDRDCDRTFKTDCRKLLECSRGSPLAAPKCLPGWSNAGALDRCYKACDEARPCAVGSCEERGAARVCLE